MFKVGDKVTWDKQGEYSYMAVRFPKVDPDAVYMVTGLINRKPLLDIPGDSPGEWDPVYWKLAKQHYIKKFIHDSLGRVDV